MKRSQKDRHTFDLPPPKVRARRDFSNPLFPQNPYVVNEWPLIRTLLLCLSLWSLKFSTRGLPFLRRSLHFFYKSFPFPFPCIIVFLCSICSSRDLLISETHDGVQDMACDTFIKIAVKCRRQFVTLQVGEVMPFIEEILTTMSTIICDLQTQQVGIPLILTFMKFVTVIFYSIKYKNHTK